MSEEVKEHLEFKDAVQVATALIAAYTRDRHALADGTLRPGIPEVVGSVARRIMANPTGAVMRETVGPYQRYVDAGFQGFTLAELAVLNRYRKQAL